MLFVCVGLLVVVVMGCCMLFGVGSVFAARWLLFVVSCVLVVVGCLVFAVWGVLFVVCCLLFVVC